ncbi:MAG: STAS domain-containing protein [Magnetococcales bacterium]|nr:STAS domain-containing protein [Magnetococcales bacterium]
MIRIDESRQGAALVLRLTGRLDGGGSGALEALLLERIAQGVGEIVVDFTGVDYISSAGLRVLLMGAKRVKPSGGRLALSGMVESIREVFEVSGFLKILPAFATVEEAREGR